MTPVLALCLLLSCQSISATPINSNEASSPLRPRRDTEDGNTRLPRDVVPVEYDLQIQPFMDEGVFRGHVSIRVECQEETDKITLHAHQTLSILNAKVTHTSFVAVEHTTPHPVTEAPTVAPVPVGAARLLPFSSSFVPENGCTTHPCSSGHHGLDHNENLEDVAETNGDVVIEIEPPVLIMKEEVVVLTNMEHNQQKQWIVLHVDRHLQRGEAYTVRIEFSGQLLNEPKNGIYMESYTDLTSREKRHYIATHMQDENARKVFPCFDEPSFKVPMEITIVAPREYTVLGNLGEQLYNDRGEWVGHQFQRSPPMATFSVAFAVFDLNPLVFDDDAGIKVYGRQELVELPNTQKALALAVRDVEVMKEYLNSDLQLGKLDIVVLPGSNSFAESNWGLIFLRESHLTCSHCLAHQIMRDVAYQWIGHCISPHWWDTADMNKALATFLAYIAELKISQETSTSSRMWFMNYPLYYEFGKRTQFTQAAFQKHPLRSISIELVLRMFNFTLGPEAFKNAMAHLINLRAFKTYQSDDVWSALTLMAGPDTFPGPGTANQIALSWLSLPRVPYVKVTRDYEKHTAEVEQHSFYLDTPGGDTDVDDALWWIPLVVVSQNNLMFDTLKPTLWMEEEKRVALRDLPSSNYFIIVNPEEVGPFLVNYDRKNWFLIAEYLDRNINNEQIPAGTRAKLIHDSLNLAFGGKLRFDSALNVSRFLIHERDPIVWQPAFNLFDHILRQLEGFKTYAKLQEYLKVLVTPAYETLVNKTVPLTAAEERMITNTKSILCAAGYEPCVAEARRAWGIWMISPEPDAGIPINLSHFCWVFKFGTRDEWEFGLERYKRYPQHLKQTDRYYLLKSLVGCPNDSKNVERLLNQTLLSNTDNDNDEDVRVLLASLSSEIGYTALFHILEDHWDAIKSRYDTKVSRLWENIVSAATMNFKTQEGYEMVSELAQQRQDKFGTATPIIERALRKIQRHVKWSEDNGVIIDQWLEKFLARRRQTA